MKLLLICLFFISQSLFAAGHVTVDVKITPAGSFKAETQDVIGTVKVNGDQVAADKIEVDLKNLSSGIALRDEHMKNKYLQVNKFPKAILTAGAGKGGKGTAKLNIKGIEKPISGEYVIQGTSVEASFELKLSDFGITGIKYMGAGVNDVIKLKVDVPIEKKTK